MRLKRRLDKVVSVFAARGALDPPPPLPTREQRLARINRWLHDVGASALWGMHTPEVWPALRGWFTAQSAEVEDRARAYLELHQPLLHAIEEHKLRRVGQIGRCNALAAINHHYGDRAHMVRPLPVCPLCSCVHTDHTEALVLAAEHMNEWWADRPKSIQRSEAEWAAVAPLVVDGLPKDLCAWFTAHSDDVEAALGEIHKAPAAEQRP